MTRTSPGALGPARRLVYAFGADLHVAADVRRDERWWYQTDVDKLEKRLGTVTRHVTDDPNVARAVFPTARDAEPCLICMATHGRARTVAIVGVDVRPAGGTARCAAARRRSTVAPTPS
jgi:hypothetical protein